MITKLTTGGLTLIAVLTTSAAWAADATETPCFDVASAGQGAQPASMILVNKCTGYTWLLTRNALADDKGKVTGAFSYRWHPIAVGTGEAQLSYPSAKEIEKQFSR